MTSRLDEHVPFGEPRPVREEDLTPLLDAMRRDAARRRALRYAYNALAGLVLIGCAVQPARLLVALPHDLGWWVLTIGALGIACLVAAHVRLDQSALDRLLGYLDVRAAGLFLEVLEYRDGGRMVYDADTRLEAERNLIRVLPMLRASDGQILTPGQRAILYRTLGCRSAALAYAALSAVEQVGDADALPYVARLLARRPAGPEDVFLREAAERILPDLRRRACAERGRTVLVRAAGPPPELTPTLLRPAGGPAAALTDCLLRPLDAPVANSQPGDGQSG